MATWSLRRVASMLLPKTGNAPRCKDSCVASGFIADLTFLRGRILPMSGIRSVESGLGSKPSYRNDVELQGYHFQTGPQKKFGAAVATVLIMALPR